MRKPLPLLAIAALLATAADKPPLEPNGPWVVEAEEAMCLLTRAYGPDKVLVGLQPLFNLPDMEVNVITRPGGSQRLGKGKLRFGEGPAFTGGYLGVKLADGRRFTRPTVPAEAFAAVGQAGTMTIDAPPVRVTVAIVRPAAGLKAFARCQDDLLRSWGVDPAAMAPDHAARPIDPAKAFRPEDYPKEALQQALIGRVIAVLTVGADGAVTRCRVVASAGKLLDDATCARAQTVRFEPGTDAAGKPAASAYVMPVRWQVPAFTPTW
jgi:TonB family protein